MGKHYYKCLACGSENCDRDGVKYFRVPANFERKVFWFRCFNKEHLLHKEMSADYRVCERHFTKDMFGNKNVRLKMHAFPVLEIPKNGTNIQEGSDIASNEAPICGTELFNDSFQMKRSASFEAEDVRIGDPQDGEPLADTRQTSIPDELFNEGFQSKRSCFEAEAVRIDDTHTGDRVPPHPISATIESTKDWRNLVETIPNVDEWRYTQKQQIETDVENLVQYRLMGGKMRLKSHVVPHRFDCQKLPPQLESAASTSNHNRVQNSSTTSILNEKKTIECLEAVVTYTSQMQHIVSNRGDLNSALQANSHLVGLLEKVVCEWFSRAQRSKEIGQITDQLFLKKAHECKQIFCIQSFEADHTWLQKFKTKYNITELDMKMLRIESNASPPSLDINDIVLDILKANPLTEFFPSSTIAVPIETDENVVVKLEEIDHQNDEAEMPTTIVNDEHARRHLKPLEEYVLLKDNFRAIGLISQLMEIFSTEIKEEDIKTELE